MGWPSSRWSRVSYTSQPTPRRTIRGSAVAWCACVSVVVTVAMARLSLGVRESGCQLVPDPFPESAAPFGVIVAARSLLQPVDDLGRIEEGKTPARGTGLVCPVRLEELDEEILAVKS